MKKFLLLFLTSVIFSSVFSGCSNKQSVYEEEIYALNTVIKMTVYSSDATAIKSAKAEIYRLESLLSVTDAESDISEINSNPDTWVKVSAECFELIKTAMSVSEASDGSFDITIYPAVKLWGFTDSSYKVPTDAQLEDVKALIGYNKIELDESSMSVKVPQGTALDLGGIAKGYIADKSAQVLASAGVTSALLNFGGNIRLIGAKPDGNFWNIGIKAPFAEGYFATLQIKDKTVSTAGGYERYFEENGVRYHHILNPYTASTAESDVISSTVIGDKGEICDALSTTAFVKGSESIASISSAYPDYSFILLTENAVYISEDIKSDFSLEDAYKDLEIITI